MKRMLNLFLGTAAAAAAIQANAGTTTAEITTNTLAAAPSCAEYRVTGVCFWLRCEPYPPNCRVITNMRVSHFSPEAVVSTWHDGAAHPWSDYGQTVSSALKGAAGGIIGMAFDSAGTNSSADRTNRNGIFRDADAIGNPVALASSGTSSTSGGMTAVQSVPNSAELGGFINRSGNLPTAKSPGGGADSENVLRNLKQAAAVVKSNGGNLNAFELVQQAAARRSSAIAGGALRAGGNPQPLAAANGMMCPATSTAFSLHFHSYLDALVWRGIIPVELLYPQSLIPGLQEIGSFPSNTWGSLYPRIGSVTQQIPIKGAAVLAQRVANIISQSGQPHIYSALSEKWGYRYFGLGPIVPNNANNSKWQRLHPNPASTCETFGTNDSVSLGSWGDGNSTSDEGYSWNLWRRLECCKVEGVFIGSIAY